MSPWKRIPVASMSRATGPQTSADAAASMAGKPLRDQQRSVLQAVVACFLADGATAYDVVRWSRIRLSYDMQQNVAAKRLSELAEMGYVVDTGKVRPGSTHRNLKIYAATEAGRAQVGERAA